MCKYGKLSLDIGMSTLQSQRRWVAGRVSFHSSSPLLARQLQQCWSLQTVWFRVISSVLTFAHLLLSRQHQICIVSSSWPSPSYRAIYGCHAVQFSSHNPLVYFRLNSDYDFAFWLWQQSISNIALCDRR